MRKRIFIYCVLSFAKILHADPLDESKVELAAEQKRLFEAEKERINLISLKMNITKTASEIDQINTVHSWAVIAFAEATKNYRVARAKFKQELEAEILKRKSLATWVNEASDRISSPDTTSEELNSLREDLVIKQAEDRSCRHAVIFDSHEGLSKILRTNFIPIIGKYEESINAVNLPQSYEAYMAQLRTNLGEFRERTEQIKKEIDSTISSIDRPEFCDVFEKLHAIINFRVTIKDLGDSITEEDQLVTKIDAIINKIESREKAISLSAATRRTLKGLAGKFEAHLLFGRIGEAMMISNSINQTSDLLLAKVRLSSHLTPEEKSILEKNVSEILESVSQKSRSRLGSKELLETLAILRSKSFKLAVLSQGSEAIPLSLENEWAGLIEEFKTEFRMFQSMSPSLILLPKIEARADVILYDRMLSAAEKKLFDFKNKVAGEGV